MVVPRHRLVAGTAPFLENEVVRIAEALDRCTTGCIMQVDYCEGEEPPPWPCP